MSTGLQNIAQVLKQEIQDFPLTGARDLVSFSEQYAVDPAMEHQAVLLRRKLNYVIEEEDKEEVLLAMHYLVDQIVAGVEESHAIEILQTKGKRIHEVASHFRQQEVPNSVVCRTKGIEKLFKGRGNKEDFHLDNINIELRQGEVTGVIGENGNGKTTLFKIIVGLMKPDSGILEYPVLLDNSPKLDWHQIKRQIAYVPQSLPDWYGDLKENLQYEAATHGIRGTENTRVVDYILARLNLEEHINKKWSELSGGFKVRFALARALVWNPKLLVIDEPLANLDIKAQLVILNDLRNLANSFRFPISILISSQHLHEVEQVSDKILFLKKGKVAFYNTLDQIGANRTKNTFELESTASRTDLATALRELPDIKIDHDGLVYVINTHLSIGPTELLHYLLHAEIPIEYFRDISKSAKKLIL